MTANIRDDKGIPINEVDNGNGTARLAINDIYMLGSTQALSYSATAGASSAIGSAGVSSTVRLISTGAVHISHGAAPTATTSDALLAANQKEYIIVNGGDKISAIQDAATGVLYITQVSLP